MSAKPPATAAVPQEAEVRTRPLARELLLYGGALAVGLLVAPLAIWLVGRRVLGPYSNGVDADAGAGALYQDYFMGLAHAAWPYWAVTLGPALLLLTGRSLIALVRRAAPSQAPGSESVN